MLEIILMLLGMAFPGSEINSNNASANDQLQTTLSVDAADDTGGNTLQNPPKK